MGTKLSYFLPFETFLIQLTHFVPTKAIHSLTLSEHCPLHLGTNIFLIIFALVSRLHHICEAF